MSAQFQRKLKAGLKPPTISVVVSKYKGDAIRNMLLLRTHISVYKYPETIPS